MSFRFHIHTLWFLFCSCFVSVFILLAQCVVVPKKMNRTIRPKRIVQEGMNQQNQKQNTIILNSLNTHSFGYSQTSTATHVICTSHVTESIQVDRYHHRNCRILSSLVCSRRTVVVVDAIKVIITIIITLNWSNGNVPAMFK